MDYRYLAAFEAAARQLHFALAASELNIAPSALSRQIALLERSLGYSLFVRSHRQVVLTAEGEALARRVSAFAVSLNEVGVDVRSGPLRIGCLQSVFEGMVAAVIVEELGERRRQFAIEVGSPRHLMQRLAAGQLDVAITTLVSEDSELDSRPLCQEDILLISPTPFGLKDIDKRGLVLYSNMARHWNELVRRHGYSDVRCTSINSYNGALELVRRGAGIGLVPGDRSLLDQQFHTRVISPAARESIFVTYRKSDLATATVARFLRQLLGAHDIK